MQKDHLIKYQTWVNAPVKKVWDALTKPEIVREYFFGSKLITSWEPGTPIVFTGSWEGQEYRDSGEVLEYTSEVKLAYSYLSSWSNRENKPENYLYVRYEVVPEGDKTLITITQSNYSPELAQHSKENWANLMEAMKKIVE